MNWTREGAVLEQILALLVSFASLADRAAGLPLSRQLPVFAFLMLGEAVARSFVTGLPAGGPAAVVLSPARDRAERLAADFRALARILRGLLVQARRRALFDHRTRGTRAASPLRPAMPGLPVVAPTAPDTS